MSDREPTTTTNLDRYGHPALPWSRVHDKLAKPMSIEDPYFLGTVGPDGRPHSAGIGPHWHDGDVYFASGAGTRKSRDLVANPACTISVRLPGVDVVLSGTADRVVDGSTLDLIASQYRDGGWPVEVADDAFTAPYSAPSAGPPPWQLYRFTFDSVVAVATDDLQGATRWTF